MSTHLFIKEGAGQRVAMVIFDLVLVAIVVYTLPLPGKEIGGGHGYTYPSSAEEGGWWSCPIKLLFLLRRGMSAGGGHDYTYACGEYFHTHPLLLWIVIPTRTPSSSSGRGHISPCGGDRCIPSLSWEEGGNGCHGHIPLSFSVKGKGWR